MGTCAKHVLSNMSKDNKEQVREEGEKNREVGEPMVTQWSRRRRGVEMGDQQIYAGHTRGSKPDLLKAKLTSLMDAG